MSDRKDRIRIQIGGQEFNVVGGGFQEMLAAVKQINGRRFVSETKVWQLPGSVEQVQHQLEISGYSLEGGAPVSSTRPAQPQTPAGGGGDRIRVLVAGQRLAVVGGSFQEMLSVLPPIFILLGLLDVWVDRATMIKYTGKGSGFQGVLIAFLLGSAAAGPLYAAFPFAAVMLKKGASLTNVLIFIGAWSTTKIPLLAFEASSMGPVFTLVRLGLSLVGIPLIAFLTDRVLGKSGREEIYALNEAEQGK